MAQKFNQNHLNRGSTLIETSGNIDVDTVGLIADGTFVTGTDPRLSDARTPLPHTHPADEVLVTAAPTSYSILNNEAEEHFIGIDAQFGITNNTLLVQQKTTLLNTTFSSVYSNVPKSEFDDSIFDSFNSDTADVLSQQYFYNSTEKYYSNFQIQNNNSTAITDMSNTSDGICFTTTKSGDLSRVLFKLKRTAVTTVETVKVDVYGVTGTVGTDAIANHLDVKGASDTVLVSSISDAADVWVEFSFSVPVPLLQGTGYAVVLNVSDISKFSFSLSSTDEASSLVGNRTYYDGANWQSTTAIPDCMIGIGTNAMTLITPTTSVFASPDIVIGSMVIDEVISWVDNISVSRDAGVTWEPAVITVSGNIGPWALLYFEADLSGQPAGTSVVSKITTTGNESLKVKAYSAKVSI